MPGPRPPSMTFLDAGLGCWGEVANIKNGSQVIEMSSDLHSKFHFLLEGRSCCQTPERLACAECSCDPSSESWFLSSHLPWRPRGGRLWGYESSDDKPTSEMKNTLAGKTRVRNIQILLLKCKLGCWMSCWYWVFLYEQNQKMNTLEGKSSASPGEAQCKAKIGNISSKQKAWKSW